MADLIRELTGPLTAIVNNAQAAQRMHRASGGDSELMEVLSDIAEDGMRAGELLRRLDAVLTQERG
ncbi:MAG: hypothetical protein ACC667_02630 [Longimicrobiales bacterium]